MDSGLVFHKVAKVLLRPTVKDFTLKTLLKQTKDSLEIIESTLKHNDKYEQVRVSLNMYEWSMPKFRKWLELELQLSGLLRLEDPDTLAVHKLLIDVKNIKYYLEEIANRKGDILIVELMGCLKVINILDKRAREFKERRMSERIMHRRRTLENFILMNAFSSASRIKSRVDTILSRSRIEIPLIFRTSMNIINTERTMAEYKMKQNEMQLVEEINRLENLTFNIHTTQRLVMLNYNIEIKNLRERLNYWIEKFDSEYELYNHEVAMYKLRIQNIYEKWLELESSMITMEMEIQNMLDRLKKEELLQKSKEEAERQLTALMNEKLKVKRKPINLKRKTNMK